jgi:hypothetical protein
MLVQDIEPQLVRPPVAVRPADAGSVVERALVIVSHIIVSHNLSPFVVWLWPRGHAVIMFWLSTTRHPAAVVSRFFQLP